MAKRNRHPHSNLGDYLHPKKKGSRTMAKAPASMAAAAPSDDDDSMMDTTGADQAGDGTTGDGGGDQSEDVLLTVLKNDDGTYTLIEGDEDDGGAGDMGSDGSESDESNGQQFDSKGSLLKAILDILNEDKSSSGAEGSSDDQFNAGYNENAPTPPASGGATMAQKY